MLSGYNHDILSYVTNPDSNRLVKYIYDFTEKTTSNPQCFCFVIYPLLRSRHSSLALSHTLPKNRDTEIERGSGKDCDGGNGNHPHCIAKNGADNRSEQGNRTSNGSGASAEGPHNHRHRAVRRKDRNFAEGVPAAQRATPPLHRRRRDVRW